MKKGMIGKKLGMTQVYTEKGVLVPVTAIELGPCPVLEVRTKEKNGYSALQLGFGSRKVKNVSKAVIGNLKKANLQDNPPAVIQEIRLDEDPAQEIGSAIKADIFAVDEFVDVVDFCNCADGKLTKMRTDDDGLRIGVADDAYAAGARELRQFVLEFSSEI